VFLNPNVTINRRRVRKTVLSKVWFASLVFASEKTYFRGYGFLPSKTAVERLRVINRKLTAKYPQFYAVFQRLRIYKKKIVNCDFRYFSTTSRIRVPFYEKLKILLNKNYKKKNEKF